MSASLQARLLDLFTPLYLLSFALIALPRTLLSTLTNPTLLLHPSALQSLWFSHLWSKLGPTMALSPEQTPYISSLFSRARGDVLELGPGGGDQMRHLRTVVMSGQVERVVGAEPNALLHARLLENAAAVGLDTTRGHYIVLEAGAEPASLIPALHRARMYPSSVSEYVGGKGGEAGVFDTIIAVKSLCSAPQAQMRDIVATVHVLLRPGGEFLFFEHVGNVTDPITRAWVWLLGWVWPVAMGNCHLNGRVDHVVKEFAGWQSVDVRETREFQGYNVFRYVVGVCKKGDS